jgi:hypothetical protein
MLYMQSSPPPHHPLQVETTPDAFVVTPPGQTFRILQVTDIHANANYFHNRNTFSSILGMCEKFNVDLVINTGDLFCRSPLFISKRICSTFDKIIGQWCPWTFAWGNHDQELNADLTKADRAEAMFAALPNCLYKPTRKFIEAHAGPGPQDDPREQEAWNLKNETKKPKSTFDGFYGGNFAIVVNDPTSGQPACDLFILNSRRGYHLPPKVFAWMEEWTHRLGVNASLPSICFYHVPNYEYHLAWEGGTAHGIKRETVCFEKDRGRVHEFLARLGSVRGVFVGHDHVNDYFFDLDGIRYVYGRKTGIGAYGGMREDPGNGVKGIKIGATLITINLAPGRFAFRHVTVFPDGITWQPQ